MLKSNFLDCSEGTAMARKIDYYMISHFYTFTEKENN